MFRTIISKAKILIVDDEQANVRLLERILELIGATRVVSTTDPREVMALFVDFRPDLVLLDLHMPHVSGFEIMEQIKVLSYEDHPVPVLVLTADVTARTKHRALSAGAKDFLTKPLDQPEVLLRIRNLLETRFLQIQQQNQNILLEEQVQERTAQLEDTLSKLRLAQQAAIKQERLSALGTMAAGIAHDFNNVLTLILGYSDLMLTDLKDQPERQEAKYVRVIASAAQDAAQIVRRLREFHRPADSKETRVSMQLNQLVEQAVTMTRPKWQDQETNLDVHVAVNMDLGELPPILGDPAELREMLTNLIFNAVDAMPDGGILTIRTRLDNGKANLSVRDTGTGMDEETRRRCLEPFYTTKGDRGTGLGLSAVYGIIERHRGVLDIESEMGRGTTFTVCLPLVKQEEVATAASPEPQPSSPARVPGDGARTLRILVVDDQEIIRKVIQEQLLEDGHQVETAEDGTEALAKYRAGHYDMMITDQTMNGMSGEELATEAKKLSPESPIILMTGYGGGKAKDNLPAGIDFILGKPATQTELRRAVVQLAAK